MQCSVSNPVQDISGLLESQPSQVGKEEYLDSLLSNRRVTGFIWSATRTTASRILAGKWQADEKAYLAIDEDNPWLTEFGSSKPADTTYLGPATCSFDRKSQGLDATIISSRTVGAGQTKRILYFMAGSRQTEQKAFEQYH